MATIAGSFLNLRKISGRFFSFSSSLDRSKKTTVDMKKVLLNKTRVTKEAIRGDKKSFAKKKEFFQRKAREDVIEAREVIFRPINAITKGAKSFLGRILDFLGSLLLGWLTYNLPTIITMATELIARIQRMVTIFKSFLGNVLDTFTGFGKVLGAVFQNVISFDFFDTSNRVRSSLGELGNNFEEMQLQFDEGMKLMTTPLSEGLVTGQDAAPIGTDYRQPPGEGTPSDAASKLSQAASQMKGFSSAAGPSGGREACVWAVNQVYKKAGLTPPWGSSEYVPTAERMMIQKGYTLVPENQRQPGDIYVAYDRKSPPQIHIGIVLANGNILSNSSSGAKFSWEDTPDGYARVYGARGKFYRMPGENQKSSPNTSQAISSTGSVLSNQSRSSVPSGGVLSTAQLVALAKQVGMTKQVNVAGYNGPLDVLMGAVAMQESRGKSTSMRSDTQVYGLWQIRFPVHRAALAKIGVTSPQQLYDPLTNAKAAKMIYDSQGITAWSAFTDGNYKKFLPEAQKAARVSPSSLSPSSLTASATSPAQVTPQATPAQISPSAQSRTTAQEISTTKPGQQVVVVDDRQAPQMIPVGGGGGGGQPQVIVVGQTLNSFIKNKLLLDLVYT